MKKNIIFSLLIILFVSFSLDTFSEKRGIEKNQIKMRLKNGKEYTATLTSKNTFSFKGVDDDCDGATIELISSNPDARKRPGKVKYANIVMKRGATDDNVKNNPLYQDKGTKGHNPLASTNERKSGSIVYYDKAIFTGDLDGDGILEDTCIEIQQKDKEVTGFLCGKTDHL